VLAAVRMLLQRQIVVPALAGEAREGATPRPAVALTS
jgi:hypothetical protein